MKTIKLLILPVCLFLCTTSVNAAEKQAKKLTCCQEAKAKEKECSHKCCLTAHQKKESCTRCNPNKEDVVKAEKKSEKAAVH
jgi:hypothetical protein